MNNRATTLLIRKVSDCMISICLMPESWRKMIKGLRQPFPIGSSKVE